jgi:carbonic anhydrase
MAVIASNCIEVSIFKQNTILIFHLKSPIASLGASWNYYDQDSWQKINMLCKNGKTQSPINIDSKKATVNRNMSIHFIGYDEDTKWNMTYDGHAGFFTRFYSIA